MISCYIISDVVTVQMLSNCIKKLSLSIKGQSNSLAECLSDVLLVKPDIIYIDILHLKHSNAELNLLKQFSCLIILSEKMEEAYEAFEFYTLDYLLKPIEYYKVVKGIEKYGDLKTYFSLKNGNQTLSKDFFFIRVEDQGTKEITIKYSNILLIEAMQNYVIFHMEGGVSFTSCNTMKHIESCLPENLFTRIHKSYIINDNRITSIVGNVVFLGKNDQEMKILIGATYRKLFFDKMGRIMIKSTKNQKNGDSFISQN